MSLVRQKATEIMSRGFYTIMFNILRMKFLVSLCVQIRLFHENRNVICISLPHVRLYLYDHEFATLKDRQKTFFADMAS